MSKRPRPSDAERKLRAALKEKVREALELARRLGWSPGRSLVVADACQNCKAILTLKPDCPRRRERAAREDCKRDVLDFLAGVLRPLPAARIALELGRRGCEHSESTLRRALDELTAEGRLAHHERPPRGYLLAGKASPSGRQARPSAGA